MYFHRSLSIIIREVKSRYHSVKSSFQTFNFAKMLSSCFIMGEGGICSGYHWSKKKIPRILFLCSAFLEWIWYLEKGMLFNRRKLKMKNTQWRYNKKRKISVVWFVKVRPIDGYHFWPPSFFAGHSRSWQRSIKKSDAIVPFNSKEMIGYCAKK